MDNKQTKHVINFIAVTEQLEQIDFIEKTLKKELQINSYQSNSATEIKRILSHENIHLIVVDDAESSLGVGSVRSAVNELHLHTTILQLSSGKNKHADYFKNGATLVCPHNDALAILHNTKLLLTFSDNQKTLSKAAETIDDYHHKFNDLYQGLADPVCYLQDGVFVDCNPAFLRAFEISERAELDELTIMNFVERKTQSEFKVHLRKSTRRDLSSSPVVFSMQTKLGKKVEYVVMSKPARFEDEEVVQVYLRSTSEGGAGGAALYDETTGLANKEQMGFYLTQKIEQFKQNEEGSAILAYVLISNYRDIWGGDGFFEAEKFIKATTIFMRKHMPAHTEISRYTDDGLLMYIPGMTLKSAETALTELVSGLDKVTPKGMARMIEPIAYIGYDEINKDKDYQLLISHIFRAAHNAALADGNRVGLPTATEVAEKDEKRLVILENALKAQRMKLSYQPIASFDPDKTERYHERLSVFDEENNALEMDIMSGVAERYQLMHHFDKWKINQLFEKLLAMDVTTRQQLQLFVSISVDALKNPSFISWLNEQMTQTGLGGKPFVFELSTDKVQNAYSAAIHFSQLMRSNHAQIAVTEIGSITKANERVINDIKPDIIKIDLNEIDTLEEHEEVEVMGDIRAKADEIGALIIAEHLESPAQLSRIWPYNITFIQGDGMTPVLDDFSFNFAEFEI